MSLSNIEKSILERAWITTTNQLGEEFQRALEDLRELFERADSAESSADAYELILDRLNTWRAHFTKYREIATEHPIGDSQSHVESLDGIVMVIAGAVKTFEDKQSETAGESRTTAKDVDRDDLHQRGRNLLARAQDLRRMADKQSADKPHTTKPAWRRMKSATEPPPAPQSAPPAPPPAAVEPVEDPLVRLAKIRAKEKEDIARDNLEIVKMTAEHGKRMRKLRGWD